MMTEPNLDRAAVRALDDPVKLARAARIIRVALERRRIALAELMPPDEEATVQ